MSFDREKFKALVHYICWKCSDPLRLGAIKLNKVLWFSDTIAFASFGEPITGVQYIKQKFGPVPKPIVPILDELARDGRLRIEDIDFYGHLKRNYIALREPDVSMFRQDQLDIVDDVLNTITYKHTALSISRLTHDAAWKLAQVGEEIPHYAALSSKLGKIDEKDMTWAKEKLGTLSKAALD